MGSTQVDLSSYIANDGSYAMNVDSQYPMENLNNSDERFEVRSDADDQLILHFQFTEKVKVSGFAIQAPKNEMRPTRLRLFINQVSIGFEDAESIPAAFEMDIEESDLEKTIGLRVVKFNGIDSITVFIEGSEGGDVSAVSSIKFFGETVQGTNMNELKKVPGAE